MYDLLGEEYVCISFFSFSIIVLSLVSLALLN